MYMWVPCSFVLHPQCLSISKLGKSKIKKKKKSPIPLLYFWIKKKYSKNWWAVIKGLGHVSVLLKKNSHIYLEIRLEALEEW